MGLMDYVQQVRPHQCTFVPDESGAFTSDHGWNLPAQIDELRPMIEQARSLGVRVCLFMDPLPDAMRHAAAAGADRVELYTSPTPRPSERRRRRRCWRATRPLRKPHCAPVWASMPVTI